MKSFYVRVAIIGGFFLFGLLYAVSTEASTATGNIGVSFTVPAAGGGGGGVPNGQGGAGPLPNQDNAPTISNVASSTTYTTAHFTWSVSDTDSTGVASVSFAYGLTNNYGSSGSVLGSYVTDLSGLATGTLYYFKITATDTGNNASNFTGTFKTPTPPPPPPDITPPVISNISATPGTTSATITWTTDEIADSQVNFGLTNNYGSTASDKNYVMSHSLVAASLLPNTLYHYKVFSTDPSGNAAHSADGTFTTQKDAVPPPDVSNLSLTTASTSFTLTWLNPSLEVVPDFVGVKVMRKVGSRPTTPDDGTAVYTGNAQTITDKAVVANTKYFYTIFSFDTSNNYSGGIFISGIISLPPPPPTPCDKNNVDCNNPQCSQEPKCQKPQPQPGCDPQHVDCTNPLCFGFIQCVNNINQNPGRQAGGSGPYTPPAPTVSGSSKLDSAAVDFFTGNDHIRLTPVNGAMTTVAGFPLRISISASNFPAVPSSVVVKIDGGDSHQLVLSSDNAVYSAMISASPVGSHLVSIEVDYSLGIHDAMSFQLQSLAYGSVMSDGKLIDGAVVTLRQPSGQPVATEIFGQPNPFITNRKGIYSWVVPNGQYYLTVEKTGFYKRATPTFTVSNNVINDTIQLVEMPPPLLEVVDPNAPLTTNIQNVAKNIFVHGRAAAAQAVQGIVDTAKIAEEAANNPAVQKVATHVVAPSVVGAAAVATVPLLSFADVVPLMRLLFLQPLMLLGLRRRSGWGQVYNALNKLPVDLVTVRLVNAETNKVVQSKVTDKQGRYAFVTEPGKYRIEAVKGNMLFPSVLLAGFKEDGRKVDIYHGEQITVSEDEAIITANIPLDPAGDYKTPRRLIVERFMRYVQSIISWVGLAVTLISLYIKPVWYVWALLGVHISLTLLFRRLAKAPKVKSWGIVYDADSKEPVPLAVARLFSRQFNKLVATQVADRKGRYYFLAGDNQYYLTVEHKNYQPQKTDTIDLTGKEADIIAVNVGLEKSTGQSVPPLPPPSSVPQPGESPTTPSAPISLNPESTPTPAPPASPSPVESAGRSISSPSPSLALNNEASIQTNFPPASPLQALGDNSSLPSSSVSKDSPTSPP